ncbi:MAG TPA: DUF4115 domain-containing protein [bacterium]|nr:DUF4115 domain-containing protein [bacterium]HPN45088.1 DUF4115 domain-containing protein [bacterium]
MKNEKNKKLELGRELAQQREDKGLTVAQLSERTKIAVKNITHIENGVFDFLPSAYVKAYLSAIAVELGLDSGVILRKYYASFVRDVDGPAHDSKPASVQKNYDQPSPPPSKEEQEIPVKPVERAAPAKAEEPVINLDQEIPPPQPEAKPPDSEPAPVAKKKTKQKPDDKKSTQPAPAISETPQAVEPPAAIEIKPGPVAKDKPAPTVTVEKVTQVPVTRREKKSSWFEEIILFLRFYSVFIFGILFLIFALVIIFWIVPERQFKKQVAELKAMMQPQAVSVQVDTLQQVTPVPGDTLLPAATPPVAEVKAPEAARQLLSLRVEVSDSAWLRIVYNDSLAEEGIFAPGDEKTWQGYDRFYMRTGNAGGIHLFMDGNFLGALPQSGVITNLQIDRDGIKTIKKTQFPKAMGVSTN